MISSAIQRCAATLKFNIALPIKIVIAQSCVPQVSSRTDTESGPSRDDTRKSSVQSQPHDVNNYFGLLCVNPFNVPLELSYGPFDLLNSFYPLNTCFNSSPF